MEEVYKGHTIIASAWQLTDRLTDTQKWQPKVWSEGVRKAEAKREAFAFAKKWIDDWKPDF